MYARFSPNDWSASNLANYSLSDKERTQAERLRHDVWRAVRVTEQRTRVRQSDATKRLGELQRVGEREGELGRVWELWRVLLLF